MESGTWGSISIEGGPAFGQWLKRRRRALDLTQRALAQQAGCSPETIKKIEAGRLRPSGQLAGLLLAGLQIPSDEQQALVRWARAGSCPAPTPTMPPRPWPGRLPAPPTALIGREQEVDQLVALLRQPGGRLLTLTGPAGIGKTRLGLQVAATVAPDFAAGAAFVPLAALTDPHLVAAQIAATLGIRETERGTLPAILLEALEPRHLLLVLDNFEQVLPARQLVAEVLAAAPQVRILVTSRTRLQLYGEHLFPVPALPLPAAHPAPAPEHLSQYAAVRLFVERARAVQPAFALTPANAGAVAEICRRLDGVPLALELAAGQAHRFAPPALLARLHRRLSVLTGGPWDRPPRQQTLRGAIAWSDDLLNAPERHLFYRLAVFQGGFAPAAAAAEAGTSPSVGDLLEALADQSLLQRTSSADGGTRFALLDTIREYALERLTEAGGVGIFRQNHSQYYLELAEKAIPELSRADQPQWLGRLDQEHENLRAALRYLLDRGDHAGAARLAGALGRFWYRRAYFSEGRHWLDAALARAPAIPAAVAATALHWAGVLAWSQGDYDDARGRLDRSLSLRRDLADQPGIAAVLTSLGAVALTEGDYDGAEALFAESLTLSRAAGDQPGIALALANLGLVRLDQGHYPEAARLLEESLALRRGLGDHQSVAQCLNNLGIVWRCRGELAAARALHAESLALFETLGDTWSRALVLANLGVVRLEEGEPDDAARLLRASLLLFLEQGVKPGIATCLDGLGWVAAAQGRVERAARLDGAAAALRAAIHAPRPPPDEVAHRRYLAVIAAHLPAPILTAAQAAGGAWPLPAATAYALEQPDR